MRAFAVKKGVVFFIRHKYSRKHYMSNKGVMYVFAVKDNAEKFLEKLNIDSFEVVKEKIDEVINETHPLVLEGARSGYKMISFDTHDGLNTVVLDEIYVDRLMFNPTLSKTLILATQNNDFELLKSIKDMEFISPIYIKNESKFNRATVTNKDDKRIYYYLLFTDYEHYSVWIKSSDCSEEKEARIDKEKAKKWKPFYETFGLACEDFKNKEKMKNGPKKKVEILINKGTDDILLNSEVIKLVLEEKQKNESTK